MKKCNVLFRNCGNKTFRLKKSHPPLFKPKLFVELDMHLQTDSVALKTEGFFFPLADSCFREWRENSQFLPWSSFVLEAL